MVSDIERFAEVVKNYGNTKLLYSIEYQAGQVVLYNTPNYQTLTRVLDLGVAEPETLSWLEELSDHDVLYDIGANMGLFTIWAAKVKGAKVIAFEPESQNYAIVCRNIVANRLDHLVQAYCLGISDRTQLDVLYLSSFDTGRSGHQVGQEVDVNLQPKCMPYTQGCMTISVDDVVASAKLPHPTRLKIDVDGIEHKVFSGARRTLADPRVVSVIVEVNRELDVHHDMIQSFQELGFRHDPPRDAGQRHLNYIFRR